MILLLLKTIAACLFSYFILVIIFKNRIKVRTFLMIGLCFYIIEISFFIYYGNQTPEGTTPVSIEEIERNNK